MTLRNQAIGKLSVVLTTMFLKDLSNQVFEFDLDDGVGVNYVFFWSYGNINQGLNRKVCCTPSKSNLNFKIRYLYVLKWIYPNSYL